MLTVCMRQQSGNDGGAALHTLQEDRGGHIDSVWPILAIKVHVSCTCTSTHTMVKPASIQAYDLSMNAETRLTARKQ